jgi:hypothetical protein
MTVVINLNLGPLSKYPMQEEQKLDEDRYKKECNDGAVKFLSFFVWKNNAIIKQALSVTQVKITFI